MALVGIRRKIPAISSSTPEMYRPAGSAPSCLKSSTDCSAPVNLNKRVCKRMIAGTTRSATNKNFFIEL